MNFLDRDSLINEADLRLRNAKCDHKRLVMIYAGVLTLASVVTSLLTGWLQGLISETSGLSGIGMRSILETAVFILLSGTSIALPFWTVGYVFCILGTVRGAPIKPRHLLAGFRRFGPLLRLNLYRAFKYFIIGVLSIYPSFFLYWVTPLADPAREILEPLVETAATTTPAMEMMYDDTILAAADAMTPWLGFYMLVLLLLSASLFYRLRMADYLLLDNPKMGAMMAVRFSTQLTYGKRMELFKLDLRFWWFYAAQVVCAAVCYVPLWLAWVGVILPAWADYACYGGALLLQFGITVLAQNRVEAAFALAYESLVRPEPQPH